LSSKFYLAPKLAFISVVVVEKVTDYELKPGGRNIRVTEETKHEYVDLVADHILTNAIRPQITSFLEGFNELVPRELISIFNDKELELLISGLPEIDCELAFFLSRSICGLFFFAIPEQ
jgi:E3 ubiquitin-protein ligase HUWE1